MEVFGAYYRRFCVKLGDLPRKTMPIGSKTQQFAKRLCPAGPVRKGIRYLNRPGLDTFRPRLQRTFYFCGLKPGNMQTTDDLFSDKKIYGDDFTLPQIEDWFEKEQEGYADLGSKDSGNYAYAYHQINALHGFRFLPKGRLFDRALGVGAAYGHEILPIADRIKNLYILEPSDALQSDQLGELIPRYEKPHMDGHLHFEDNFFDLITCLGTLHHIPNVSTVIRELHRTLQPGGYFLLREPIISMGDWRQPRRGLTRNERGLPIAPLRRLLQDLNFEIVHEGYCFTMTAFIERTIGRFFPRQLFTYRPFARFDQMISTLLKWNYHYHPTKMLQRVAPTSVYYVLRKK